VAVTLEDYVGTKHNAGGSTPPLIMYRLLIITRQTKFELIASRRDLINLAMRFNAMQCNAMRTAEFLCLEDRRWCVLTQVQNVESDLTKYGRVSSPPLEG